MENSYYRKYLKYKSKYTKLIQISAFPPLKSEIAVTFRQPKASIGLTTFPKSHAPRSSQASQRRVTIRVVSFNEAGVNYGDERYFPLSNDEGHGNSDIVVFFRQESTWRTGSDFDKKWMGFKKNQPNRKELYEKMKPVRLKGIGKEGMIGLATTVFIKKDALSSLGINKSDVTRNFKHCVEGGQTTKGVAYCVINFSNNFRLVLANIHFPFSRSVSDGLASSRKKCFQEALKATIPLIHDNNGALIMGGDFNTRLNHIIDDQGRLEEVPQPSETRFNPDYLQRFDQEFASMLKEGRSDPFGWKDEYRTNFRQAYRNANLKLPINIQEPSKEFLPTCKMRINRQGKCSVYSKTDCSGFYDNEKTIPSWCDRVVFYNPKGNLICTNYVTDSKHFLNSDHQVLVADFVLILE
jgi:hypothetical protein